jgi:arsenate reductase-like glutaredoxin family protein
MIERLKSAVTEDEIREVLSDIIDSDEYKNIEIKSYINSREDLVEILNKMKTKTNFKTLLSDIDNFNKDFPDLIVPESIESVREKQLDILAKQAQDLNLGYDDSQN